MFVCLGLERSLGFPPSKNAPGSCLMPAVARWSSLQWRARRPASNVGSIPAINIHQNLSKKMRQSSWKLTCWGSELFTFLFFLGSVEFSTLFQYVPWRLVYSPIFAMVINPFIGILYIYLQKKRIPIYSHYGMDDPSYTMFWQRPIWPHMFSSAKCTLSLRRYHFGKSVQHREQAKAWGSAQGVAPTGGHETAQMG